MDSVSGFMSLFDVQGENALTASKAVSPVISILTNHQYLKEHCKKMHPDVDNGQCAMAYSLNKPFNDYDYIST